MIKFSKINIADKDINVVKKILKSGWLTHGKYNYLFEDAIKNYTKAKFAITTSSCTSALHLSCIAAGFTKGDEVIVPSQTHTATAHAVEYTGAKAILTDVDLITGNLSIEEIKKKINKNTKGIIAVHMAGYPCNLKEILSICKKNKLKLIEDCAHALGTTYEKVHVGHFGLTGCFSFYPTKQITTGEGGALITNNRKIFEKVKMLKSFGIDKDINQRSKPGEYDVKKIGFNYRMSDFQASLGYFQLKRYSGNLFRRKVIAKRYIRNLKFNKKIKHMPFSNNCSFFVFQVFSKSREKLIDYLKKKKIQFSIHYANSLDRMSYYKKKYNLKKISFKNSIEYGKTCISLPVYPKLKNKEIDYICKTINDFSKQ